MSALRLLVTALVPAALSVAAPQSHHPYVYRPVSISFVPGFSTNGPGSRYFRSNLSLNVIGGELGQVEGVELGGVFNIDEADVYGYQAAGVFNIVDGVFGGVQQAGVFNIVEQNMLAYQGAGVFNIVGGAFGGVQQAGVFNVVGNGFAGAQMAGAANIVGGDFVGAEMAGAFNIVGNGFSGAQMAGAVNIAGANMTGAQLSGAVNITRDAHGLQLAGAVNVAEEFNGAQIGLVNICGTGHGLQLGLVNIAEDVDVPIGLVSIVENGPFHINAWATEFSPVNIGIKAGSRTVYNVFMLGWRPGGDEPRLYAGLGIGGHIPLDRFFVDIDILNHGVYRDGQWYRDGGPELLSSLRLTGGWQFNDFLAFTAGPTLNLSVFEDDSRDEDIRLWPGFTVGLQLL